MLGAIFNSAPIGISLIERQELLDDKRATFRIVMRYRTQAGSVCWVRCTVSLLQEGRGQRATSWRVPRTSPKLAAAKQLREWIEPFNLLVASVTDYAIFILDPEGGANEMQGCLYS